jgi:hypothetical protein
MRPQSRPMSPARFGALRPEPSSGGLSARSSPVKQNGTDGKEQPGGLYREGRNIFFFSLCPRYCRPLRRGAVWCPKFSFLRGMDHAATISPVVEGHYTCLLVVFLTGCFGM